MSANATGTPTALGIPTFNPANDVVNGLGVNEMMAAIDPLISARMFAPSSPSTNQAVIWNGTTWVASFISPANLSQDGATTGQALVWNGSAWAPGSITAINLNFQPADPTAYNSSSLTMMGLGTTVSFTPSATGKVYICFSGDINVIASGTQQYALYIGTGTAAANGAAASSYTKYTQTKNVGGAGSNSFRAPFQCSVNVSLTAGTTYWADIALNNNSNGNGDVALHDLDVQVTEVA